MFWLDDDLANIIANNEEGLRGAEKIGQALLADQKPGGASPGKKQSPHDSSPSSENQGREPCGFTAVKDRKLNYSGIEGKGYDSSDLVHLLYTALLCGIAKRGPSVGVKGRVVFLQTMCLTAAL